MFFRMILFSIVLFSLSAHAEDQYLLENFNRFKVGTFNESGWHVRDKENAINDVYSIASEGDNLYLHADNEGQFVQLFKRGGWSVKHRPYLTWKWRVIQHPEGANPETKLNDCAAGVYVVFKKSLFSVRTIKYVWTPEGKVEHVIHSRLDNPQITIRVGSEDVGKWVTEKRNIKEDYMKFFDKDPGNAVAFGIITEADSVKVKKAIADYDDFYAVKE